MSICFALVVAIALLVSVEAAKESDSIVIGEDGQIVFRDSDKKDGGTYVIARRRRSLPTRFVPYPHKRIEQLLLELV